MSNDTAVVIKAGDLRPSPFNPRRYFDEVEHQELVASIKATGQIQAIVARVISGVGGYEIIAGERRWRAIKDAFGDEGDVVAIIKDVPDEVAEAMAMAENVIRSAMSVCEEAVAASRKVGHHKGNREAAAAELGWNLNKLNRRLALMNLDSAVMDALNARKIEVGHAELLAAAPKEKQVGAMEKIIAHGLTIAQVKENLGRIAQRLDAAIFDKSECANCSYNSTLQGSLFSESVADGHCTNGSCYETKTQNQLESIRASLVDDVPTVRIVTAGMELSYTPIVAEGAAGVGQDQASACRGCQNFGHSVSAIPGSLGNVERDVCFDVACNQQKIAARVSLEKKAEKTPNAEQGTAEPKGKKNGQAEAEKAPVTAVTSKSVMEYRLKLWRFVTQKELVAAPIVAESLVVGLALTDKGREISGSKMREIYMKVTGEPFHLTDGLGEAVLAMGAADADIRRKLVTAVAVSAIPTVPERDLIDLMKAMKIDLGKHWTLKSEFLSLMTKSEIELVAEEIGIAQQIGDDFKKALVGKKGDLIDRMLKDDCSGFFGVVPKCVKYA